jgi:hypothetical protein
MVVAVALAACALLVPAPTPANAADPPFTGPLAVGRTPEGRLDVFAVSGGRTVYHKVQIPGGWTTWYTLGAPPFPEAISDIDVANNQNGGEELVVAGEEGSIAFRRLSASGTWGGWTSLGTGGDLVEIVANADGRLEIFAGGLRWDLSNRWQTTPNGNYSGRHDLGDGTIPVEQLTVIKAPDNRLQVFVGGTGSASMYTKRQLADGWSGWANLGAPPGYTGYDSLKVAANSTGALELFAVDRDLGAIVVKPQAAGGSWGSWVRLRRVGVPPPVVGMTVGAMANGRLAVFACIFDGIGNLIVQWTQAGPASWNHEWDTSHGAVGCGNGVGEVEVARNADGRLELFTLHDNRRVYHRWQLTPNGTWSPNWRYL